MIEYETPMETAPLLLSSLFLLSTPNSFNGRLDGVDQFLVLLPLCELLPLCLSPLIGNTGSNELLHGIGKELKAVNHQHQHNQLLKMHFTTFPPP